MCSALLEIMEPEIQEITKANIQKTIMNSVKSFREFGHDDDEIKAVLMKNYGLSPEEAESYLK